MLGTGPPWGPLCLTMFVGQGDRPIWRRVTGGPGERAHSVDEALPVRRLRLRGSRLRQGDWEVTRLPSVPQPGGLPHAWDSSSKVGTAPRDLTWRSP